MESKVFLIYVEGESDDTIISPMLEHIISDYDNKQVNIEILFGDPFSRPENDKKSGKTIVKENIEQYLKTNHLKATDILYVAFITDIDGIFVNPTDYIVNDIDRNFEFDLINNKVVCINRKYKNSLIKTRQNKAKKIAQINSGELIHSVNRLPIPFGIYYNSINLEHILIGKILSGDEKIKNADDILDRFEDNLNDLIKLFTTKSLSNNYEESWLLIKTNNLSKPCSNLNILFNKLQELSSNK